MRTALAASIVAALSTCSAACYESSAPLSAPGLAIDPALPGSWNCRAVESGDPVLVRIWRFDERQYYFEIVEDSDVDRYQGYPSRVGDQTLVNVRDLEQKGSAERWVFVRYALDGRDRVQFWLIPDTALKGVEPAQALATIRRRVGDATLYQRVADCRRP